MNRIDSTPSMRRFGIAKKSLLVTSLFVATLAASCKKQHDAVLNPATSSADGEQLKNRITDFYARMKSIHEGRQAGAHSKTTGDANISIDSAEFLIEATYNYEVSKWLDSSDVDYHTFSFTIPVSDGSTLSETEVSTYMYQMKDSMMVVYDQVDYEDPALSLFDLEIEHTAGAPTAEIVVGYSIISTIGRPVIRTYPGVFNGSSMNAWACLTSFCSPGTFGYYMTPPSTYAIPGYMNAYVNGQGMINFSNATASGVACATIPGAAASLRNQGIYNYWVTQPGYNPFTLPPFLVNITLAPQIYPARNNGVATHDYNVRGISSYQQSDQYDAYCNYTVNGQYVTTGTSFYCHWLNTPMMNYYLGYIPGKIASRIPTGKTLRDFQIVKMESTSISGTWLKYVYNVYYGTEAAFPWRESQISLSNF